MRATRLRPDAGRAPANSLSPGWAALLDVRDGAAGARVRVRAKPRSSRAGVVGLRDGALEVAVHAPPVEGAANEELVQVLADALGVKRASVTVLWGAEGRDKLVELGGLDAATVRARLVR